MKHRHLSLQERYYIEIELKKGSSQNTIAKALNRQQGADLTHKKRHVP
jgi:IS30 family transposase